ncbi:MAG: hypothetical protein WBV39_09985 [Rudaea sp.]
MATPAKRRLHTVPIAANCLARGFMRRADAAVAERLSRAGKIAPDRIVMLA